MLKLIGDVKIFNIKENEKFINGSILNGSKNRKGEWDNQFYDVTIVGKGIQDYVNHNIQEKDIIEITDSLIRMEEYNGKIYAKITIFGLKKAVDKKKETPSWKK